MTKDGLSDAERVSWRLARKFLLARPRSRTVCMRAQAARLPPATWVVQIVLGSGCGGGLEQHEPRNT
jgi:hypothetical protein